MDNQDIYEIFGCKYGSPVIQCSCGRYNYAYSDYMNEGEFDELEEKRNKDPKHYILHSQDDCVLSIELDGATKVFDCDCKWEERLKRFLVSNEREFLQFYKNKLKAEKKQLESSIKEKEELFKEI